MNSVHLLEGVHFMEWSGVINVNANILREYQFEEVLDEFSKFHLHCMNV